MLINLSWISWERSSKDHLLLAPYFAGRGNREKGFVVPCNFGDAKVTVISAQDRNENFVITVAFSA